MTTRTAHEIAAIIFDRLVTLHGEAAAAFAAGDADKLDAITADAIATAHHQDTWKLSDANADAIHAVCFRIETREFVGC